MRPTASGAVRGWMSLLVCGVVLIGGELQGWAFEGVDDPHDVSSRAESHYQLAVRFFGEGRYREAVDEFDRAIALTPEAIFYCNRAVSLIKLDEMDAALRSMKDCRDRFEGEVEELWQIDAQTRALEVVVRSVRVHAVSVARDISLGGVVPVAEPADRTTGWTAGHYGYLGLGLGMGFLGGALALDLASAGVKEEYLAQSRGGEGTSAQEHALLAEQLRDRQRAFYGLLGAGTLMTAAGATFLTYHYGFSDRSRAVAIVIEPEVRGGNYGMSLRLSF